MRDEGTFDIRAVILFGAILCFAAGLRLIGLDKSIWLDEGFILRLLHEPVFLNALRVDMSNPPPLYLVLLKAWSLLSMRIEFLRALSALFNMATIILLMAWLKQYSRPAAALGGLMASALPILLRYSQEMRAYSLFVLCAAAVFFFAARIPRQPGGHAAYAGFALSLATANATHMCGIMLLVPALALMMTAPGEPRQIRLLRLAGWLCIPLLVFAGYYHLTAPRPASWWMPAVSMELFVNTGESLLGLSPFGHPAANLGWLLLLAVAAILTIPGECNRAGYPFLLAALVYMIEITAYSLLVAPVFWVRTLLPAVVLLIPFAAIQVAGMAGTWKKAAVAGLCVAINLTFAAQWVLGAAHRPVEEWARPAAMVASEFRDGDRVILFPDYIVDPVRAYWPSMPAGSTAGIHVESPDEEIARQADLAGTRRVFLVIRPDLTVRLFPSACRRLLSVIAARRPPTADVHVFVVTCADEPIVPALRQLRLELDRDLQSAFGRPKNTESFAQFTYTVFGQNTE